MTRFSLRRAFVVGFCLGIAICGVVILSQSLEVFWTPLWQQILLFPGMQLGHLFYDCCNAWFPDSWDVWPEIVVGSIIVGLWYGTVCCGLALLFRKLSGLPTGMQRHERPS